jgi:hypothetical protein
MLHEMKGIGDGWQNIEVCQMSHICVLSMLLNNYVNIRWCIKLVVTIFIIIYVWL